MVEVRDVVRLPDTRGLRPADQDVVPAGLGTRELRPRSPGRPALRERLARLPVPARPEQSADGLRQRWRGVPARRLQPAGERVHRVRVPSRFRQERSALFGACGTGHGQSQDARLHPARLHGRGGDLSQRDHGMARHEPRREHVRGHQARAASRGSRGRLPLSPDRPVEFNPTSKPGAPDYGLLYVSVSDLAFSNGGGPRANNPSRPSVSTRLSPPSCASIRAVLPRRRA